MFLKFYPLFIVSTLFLVVFFETITLIVKGWITHSGSHGFLIFAISLFIIWNKRSYLKTIPTQPAFVKGSLLTMFGCLLFVAGKFSITIILQKISLIITLLGILWLLMGTNYLKSVYLPILYLIFTFPIFDTLLGDKLIYLQLLSAYIASNLLTCIGISTYCNGKLITLPHITLDVARECSGINHIMALVATAVPLAYFLQKSRGKKIVLVIIAFCIGIIANGLRIGFIGIWTYFNKEAPIHGPIDIFLVSFIFGFGIVVIISISFLLRRISLKKIRYKGNRNLINKATYTQNSYTQNSYTQNSRKGAMITGMIILFITIIYIFLSKPVPIYPKNDLRDFPMIIGDWVGKEVKTFGESFEIKSPDIQLKRVYHSLDGEKFNLYVGYYATQKKGREVFDSKYNSYLWKSIQFNYRNNTEVSFRQISKSKNVYSWFVVNGKLIDKPILAKIEIVKNAFLYRKNNAAIVILMTEYKEINQNIKPTSKELEFISLITPLLQTYLQ